MKEILALNAAAKVFPGAVPVTALAPTDLRIDAGETVALVGPSGSGKTTLLHLFGTLERPSAGAVRIDGLDVSTLADRDLAGVRSAVLGFVFQQFCLLDHMSAVANVALGTLYRGTPRRQRRTAAEDALDRVGLAHRRDHRPAELSGGERQRVAIARAVVGHPPVLLADEPTGNLDSENGASILALLRSLSRDGVTVVVATHDASLARALRRQVTLRDGEVVADETEPGAR